jgi:F-type H+-transporting ATPase subunit a
MKHIFFLIGFCSVLCLSNVAAASEAKEHKEGEEEKFNVIELIMHHIKDAHEWHILDYKKSDGSEVSVSVPLPVILYANGQLDVFLSSEFDHGHKVVEKGDNKYIIHHEKIYLADEHGELKMEEKEGEHVVLNTAPLDFSITKNVFSMMIMAVVLILVFTSVARSYKKNPGRPRGLQAFMEPLILYVKDEIVYPNLGKKTDKFMPYLLTVFFFILFNNLLGIIPIFPGNANVTGNIAVTMTLALFTFLMINLNGNKHYWKHTLWMQEFQYLFVQF